MTGLRQYLVNLDEPVAPQKDEAGRGCFGAVYKSKLNGAQCVVKKLHDILTGSGGYQYVSESQWGSVVEKFKREIELLSKQRHPNIVQFLGVCGIDGDSRNISLVMEQLEMDLQKFINDNKGRIPLSIKLSILRDAACGVSHLHSSGIVHRDLNAGNVLLTRSLQAKVADLGVSRIIGTGPQSLTAGPGALDYMPPEALQEDPIYGPKLDCFSFGHLSLYFAIEIYPRPIELSTRSLDLRARGDGQSILSLQIQKRRKWIQMLGDQHPLEQFICVCLDDVPEKRHDMKTMREQLEEMLAERGFGIPQMMELMKENEELKGSIQEKGEHRVKEVDKDMDKDQGTVNLMQQTDSTVTSGIVLNMETIKRQIQDYEARLHIKDELITRAITEKEDLHERLVGGHIVSGVGDGEVAIRVTTYNKYQPGDIVLFHPVGKPPSDLQLNLLHLNKPRPYIFLHKDCYPDFRFRFGRIADLVIARITRPLQEAVFKDDPVAGRAAGEEGSDSIFYYVWAEPAGLDFQRKPGRPPNQPTRNEQKDKKRLVPPIPQERRRVGGSGTSQPANRQNKEN